MTYMELGHKLEDNEPIAVILPAGLMPMVVITPEMMRRYEEGERRRQERDKDKQPPKPPRGRFIGRVALGYQA